MHNPCKKSLFTADQRVELLEKATKEIPNIEICKFEGLLVDFAKQRECNVVLKGLRSIQDFEYEKDMALCNKKLYPDLETVILNTDPKYSCVSSSAVRDILYFGGDLAGFVPQEIKEEIQQLYKINMGE